MGLRTAIAGTLRSPMLTISKKLAKREKRARFPHERARKIFWSRFGVYRCQSPAACGSRCTSTGVRSPHTSGIYCCEFCATFRRTEISGHVMLLSAPIRHFYVTRDTTRGLKIQRGKPCATPKRQSLVVWRSG